MSDVSMQDLMMELTEAVLAEASDPEIHALIARYGLSRSETDESLRLIQDLRHHLRPVPAPAAFRVRLKAELMQGYAPQSVPLVKRWRSLPGRVQIAALLALMGGVLLLFKRRLDWVADQRDTLMDGFNASA